MLRSETLALWVCSAAAVLPHVVFAEVRPGEGEGSEQLNIKTITQQFTLLFCLRNLYTRTHIQFLLNIHFPDRTFV